jgi:small-conductance mechanosensitive channel
MPATNLKSVSSRPPEREELSRAIARKRVAEEKIGGIQKAKRTADERRYEVGRAIEEAKAAVEKAKASAADHLVDAALGRAPGNAPQTVKQARAALQEIEDKLETLVTTSKALDDREKEWRPELEQARREVDEAVRNVLKSSPSVCAIYDRHQALQREAAGLLKMMNIFQDKYSVSPEDYEPASHEELNARADVSAQISVWEAAIAALRVDADAPLPN